MSEGKYRMDVVYPLGQFDITAMDVIIEDAVGKESESSGGGIGGRDLQFYFDSENDRTVAALAVASIQDHRIDVVRRTDLDPPRAPALENEA